MRTHKTRGVLAGLLCPVVLLASCATSQKITNGTDEMWASNNSSSAQEQTTAFRSGAWTYYETYYGTKTAERLLQKETVPVQVPQEAESEEPDDTTTLGDVAVGTLKVLGLILLVTIMLAGSAGAGFSGW